MSWLSNAFGGHNKNPGAEANKYLQGIPGDVKPLYDPYMQNGIEGQQKLKDYYDQIMNHPGDFYNKLGEGYQQSPGYAATLRQAMSGANNAAARGAGGGIGSPGAINNSAQAAGDVANQDFEKYLMRVLGLSQQGAEGTQHLEDQGYGATTDYASLIAQIKAGMGQNVGNDVSAQNQKSATNWGSALKLAGTGLGAIAGGPIGAGIGSWLGGTPVGQGSQPYGQGRGVYPT